MYRPKSVVHIDFQPIWSLFDARPIFKSMDDARGRGALRTKPKIESKLSEICLHLATRANILRMAVERLNRHMEEAIDIVRKAHASTPALVELPDQTVYGLLLYLDSFFFEAKAFEEHLHSFFVKVLQHICGDAPEVAREKYAKISLQCGSVDSVSWKEFLYRIRRVFIHLAAPWVAVDTSKSERGIFDFLIMAENLHDFSTASKDSFFLAIRDMNLLWMALQRMAETCEDYLAERISKLPSPS